MFCGLAAIASSVEEMVWQGRGAAGCCLAPYQVECEKIFPRVDKATLIYVFFGSV